MLLLQLISMWIAIFTFLIFMAFLWFTLDLYILGPLKRLMTSGSIKNIEVISSLFLWVPFLILFFHVSVKYKRHLRLKCVLVAFVFPSSNFYLSTYGNIVYNNVKLCHRLQSYSPDYRGTCNELDESLNLRRYDTIKNCRWSFFKFSRVVRYRKICKNQVQKQGVTMLFSPF